MKKIIHNLLAGILVAGLLTSCSSENTTGVESNTENNQSEINGNMTDTTTTGTDQDNSNQNPPTDNTGNQDQN